MVKLIRKAIIPAAGLGTRFLPATKAMPKEMLPIVDKPVIQYVVEEAVAAGIEDIMIVTGRSKRSIEDHFDKNVELEQKLKEANKLALLQLVCDVGNLANIHYIRQKEVLGLGHAIWSARKFIGNEPFAVLLGDMIIVSEKPCIKQLIDVYNDRLSSVIAVERVEWPDVGKYGIIDGEIVNENLYLAKKLVEKPNVSLPSNLAIMGRYILEPVIFDILEQTKPGVGGEIQLTDALAELARHQELFAYKFAGTLYDVGDKLGFLKATVEFAFHHEELKEPFSFFIRKFLADRGEGERI